MSEDNENNKNNLEVVEGIGNLDISPVYDNLISTKPKMKDEKPKNIVVPQVKKPIEKSENENKDEDKTETEDSVIIEDTESTEDLEETIDDLVDIVEDDDSDVSEDEVEFEDIEFEDVDLDDDIDEAD